MECKIDIEEPPLNPLSLSILDLGKCITKFIYVYIFTSNYSTGGWDISSDVVITCAFTTLSPKS